MIPPNPFYDQLTSSLAGDGIWAAIERNKTVVRYPDKLTMQHLYDILDDIKRQFDREDCAAAGWDYLPLDCGLYDA